MAVTRDIAASYRGPAAVVRRLFARTESEPRMLAYLMAACAVIFIAQWPKLARQAHLEETELNPLLGASLMAWIFLAPLIFYTLALLIHLVAKVLSRPGTGYGARLALFWALLASTPLMLLEGLVGGFIGPGPGLQAVGFVWLVVFGWFLFSGLRVVYGREDAPS